jgi:DNA-binding NarL/FixJ family response regulator
MDRDHHPRGSDHTTPNGPPPAGDPCGPPRHRPLGPDPERALAALVGYGLSDADIARYHGLRKNTVRSLRLLWGIRPEI